MSKKCASIKQHINTVSDSFFHIVHINCFFVRCFSEHKLQFIKKQRNWMRQQEPQERPSASHAFGSIWWGFAIETTPSVRTNSPTAISILFVTTKCWNYFFSLLTTPIKIIRVSLSLSFLMLVNCKFSIWQFFVFFFRRSAQCCMLRSHIHWTAYMILIRSLFNHDFFFTKKNTMRFRPECERC